MDEENKLASCLGWVVAWSVTLVIGVIMDGWALSTIWNWFMPTIFGLTALTMMQAIGVAMVFSLFTRTNRISNKDEDKKKTPLERFIETTIIVVLSPILSVIVAYIFWTLAF